ncbi:MAG: response regulator [Syntrophobacteraceae bacterium]|nr:response regulator [Syntrophobacteraceae bacterium]
MKTGEIEKILIVDDEESIGIIVKSFLQRLDYFCQSVTSASEALEMLGEDHFDLVISDIRMNGLNGLELVGEIRRRFPRVATMIMSGFMGDHSYSDVIKAGAVDFIAKPLSLEELQAKIVRLDGERRIFRELKEANQKIGLSLTEMTKVNERLTMEIAERGQMQAELSDAHREIEAFLYSIPCILIEVSTDGTIKRWNTLAESILRINAEESLGKKISECPIAWESEKINEAIHLCGAKHLSKRLNEVRFTRGNGMDGMLDLIFNPVDDVMSQRAGLIILGTDITDYKLMERQLAQSQKLESIGQLAAGIAHEINTPTQYVADNTRFLDSAFGSLERVHLLYDQLLCGLRAKNPAEPLIQTIAEAQEQIDFDFLRQEIPGAIHQSLEGIDRITRIVRSMKEFSHPGTEEKTGIDINKAIENTITVARNEWKYVASVSRDFDPALPPVHCLPGEFNQVILNMIINSSHAIADKVGDGSRQKGSIGVSTRRDGDFVEIRISDDGNGIREDIRSRIFDPFFTTKDVGRGTGQGLAISHSVIVKKHGGTIDFESKLGEGTTFIIKLPI